MQSLIANRFHASEQVRNLWTVILPEEVDFDDVLKPDFWSHVAYRLTEMSRVEVYREDGTEWAELLVTFVDRVSAKMVILNHVALVKETPDVVDPEYTVGWAGPHAKFRIVRIADSEVIQDKFPSKEAAELGLREYLKALAA